MQKPFYPVRGQPKVDLLNSFLHIGLEVGFDLEYQNKT